MSFRLDVLRTEERELINKLAQVRVKIRAEETRLKRDPEETERRIRALLAKPAQAGGDPQ